MCVMRVGCSNNKTEVLTIKGQLYMFNLDNYGFSSRPCAPFSKLDIMMLAETMPCIDQVSCKW